MLIDSDLMLKFYKFSIDFYPIHKL